MKIRLLAFLVLSVVTFMRSGSAADLPPTGVTLIPHGTIFKTFADYEQTVSFDPDHYNGQKIVSAELEFRFPQDNLRIIRFPYIWMLNSSLALDDQRPVKVKDEENDGLDDACLRRMGFTRPGFYQAAFYLNGIRASNVISFQIDPQFEPLKRPVLELATLEPNPFQTHAQLLVLAYGPTPVDPTLLYSPDFCSSPLEVDGIERKITGGVAWEGPVQPLRSGLAYYFIPQLTNYLPAIDPNKPHTVGFKSGKYETAPFQFDSLESKMNRDWDAATLTIKDPSSKLPIQLQGTVRDGQGKTLSPCEVRLHLLQNSSTQNDHRFIEYTDQNGNYQFVGIPPGTYRVGCSYLPKRGERLFPNKMTVTVTNTDALHFDIQSIK